MFNQYNDFVMCIANVNANSHETESGYMRKGLSILEIS